MQEELDLQEHRAKHGKKSGKQVSPASAESLQSAETLNSVIGRELQAKIDENAELHAKLSYVDRRYEELVGSLQDRIRELESEARKKSQAERAEEARHKDLVAGLKAEMEEMARQTRQLERELVDHQDRITVLTVQLESASAASSAHQVSGSASPSKQQISSCNNFPLTVDDARIQSVELLSQFGDCVTDLIAGFSDFHTYWEHRLKDVGADGPLWDDADRLSKLLLKNVKYLKPVEEAYQAVLSKVLSRKEEDRSPVMGYFLQFCRSFKSYVSFACEAESLTVSCLQYESHRYSCPPSQQAFNSQLQSSLRAFNRVLSRSGDYLQEAVDRAESDGGERAAEAVESLSVCLSQLAAQAAELARTYANKAADEGALPTVTEQLKNTNQCIVAALGTVQETLTNLSRLVTDNGVRISTLLKSGNSLPLSIGSENKGDWQKTDDSGVADRAHVRREEGHENEEVEVLRERRKHLEEVVGSMGDKIKELEQKREHWKLEYQLLQMKYEKLKVDKSREGDAAGEGGAEEEEEKESADPLRARLQEVLGERLHADSKAVALLLEWTSQRRRLAVTGRRLRRAEERLRESQRAVALLRDEAGAAAANYEGQLGLMTEHVANMNDKLTSQSDEIESLKYELTSKNSKKGGKGKGK